MERERARWGNAGDIVRSLQALLQGAPALLFWTDLQGAYRFSAGHALLGGRPLLASEPWVAALARRALAGEAASDRGMIGGACVELRIVPLEDGLVGLATEVTAEQQAEARMSALSEVTSEGVLLHEEGKIIYANSAAARMLGYPAEEMVGMPILCLSDDREHAAIMRRFTEGDTGPRDIVGVRRDGSHFLGQVRARSVELEGRGVRVLTMRDIGEQRLGERALERTVSLLQATIESTADGILVVDRQGKVTRFNRKFADLWRIPDEVMRSQDDPTLIAYVLDQLVDPDGFVAKVRQLYDQPEVESFDVLEFKDGRVYERFSGPQRLGDDVVGRVWSFRDVSERERAEEERDRLLAQEQEARSRATFMAEVGRLLSSRLDYEETLPEVARLAVPFLGDWCAIDELGKDGKIRRLAVVHADAGKAEVARRLASWTPILEGDGVGRALRTGEPVLVEDDPEMPPLGFRAPEHQVLLRQAGMRSYLCVPANARGKTLGALTLVSASNPRRYGPADVGLARALANRVALTIDNVRLYRETQESVRLRDDFLSIASHELNTPMTSLLLSLQSLLSSSEIPADPERLLKLVSIAERQGRRLNKLIMNLLDVSRISTGRLVLHREPVDLTGLVREVVGDLAEAAQQAGSRVSVDGQPASGDFDRTRLEQVVTNLLANAIKYGNGQPILVSVSESGDSALLRVVDHGIGIAPEEREHVFDRFGRAASTDYAGLGLGLFICRSIVVAHGGAIRLETTPGGGSTFTVELPRYGEKT